MGTSERECKSVCVCVCVCLSLSLSVCVTYSFWCAGGLRVLDIYANHFVVSVAVMLDQDVQARLAFAARVSNQIRKSFDMFTVYRSSDLTFFFCCCC